MTAPTVRSCSNCKHEDCEVDVYPCSKCSIKSIKWEYFNESDEILPEGDGYSHLYVAIHEDKAIQRHNSNGRWDNVSIRQLSAYITSGESPKKFRAKPSYKTKPYSVILPLFLSEVPEEGCEAWTVTTQFEIEKVRFKPEGKVRDMFLLWATKEEAQTFRDEMTLVMKSRY